MTAFIILLAIIAMLLALRICAAQIEDGETLHDLAVRVHTLRNEYLAQLRGDEIIEVDVVGADHADSGVAGAINPTGDAEAQAA